MSNAEEEFNTALARLEQGPRRERPGIGPGVIMASLGALGLAGAGFLLMRAFGIELPGMDLKLPAPPPTAPPPTAPPPTAPPPVGEPELTAVGLPTLAVAIE